MKSQSKGKSPLSPDLSQRFRCVKELGRGGAGIVYLAEDLRHAGTSVALKVLQRKKRSDPSLAASLQNEFATLSQLSHPHLAKVLDYGISSEEIFLSSEWIDGQDFLQATTDANLNTTFSLLLQVLQGLDYLHRRGILHLDLKPGNILVTDPQKTGMLRASLIDFGIARPLHSENTSEEEISGSPPYLAPEILLGQSPRPSSDLYALGIMLCQIFTRSFPFKGKNPVELMKEQIYSPPTILGELHSALPRDFSQFLLKTVARRPEDRFQNVQELLSSLNSVLRENFSLRPRSAPLNILEESDYFFHATWIEKLLEQLPEQANTILRMDGPKGCGKTRAASNEKWGLRRMYSFPSAQWCGLSPQPVTIRNASPFAGRASLNACSTSDSLISFPSPLSMRATTAARKNSFSTGIWSSRVVLRNSANNEGNARLVPESLPTTA